MTVKELAEAYGLSTQQIFQNGYDRYGLLYSIGGPQVTHARYEEFGYVPIYVARIVRDMERMLTEQRRKIN